MIEKQIPRRLNSLRLQGYDYSEEGVYFITIVTHGREKLIGEVVDGEMVLNEFGKIVEVTWLDLINHNTDIELDEFVVMPNHIHGIIQIFEPSPVDLYSETNPIYDRADHGPSPTGGNNSKHHSLCEIVRQFTTFSAKRINQLRDTLGIPVWQRIKTPGVLIFLS